MQKGAVLLFLVAFMVLGSATFFLANQSINRGSQLRDATISNDMQRARQALISYAVNYADSQDSSIASPGHFPCPSPNESHSPSGSNCDAYDIGRLPIYWKTKTEKTQEIYPFAEDSARRFWYVSAEALRPNRVGVNPDVEMTLRVDGVGDIAAVIIDPGPPLSGQTRPSNDASDYLEGGNEDGDPAFVTSSDQEFNDRIVFITRDELMPLVERRVLGYVRDWLQAYYNDQPDPKYFPTPAPLDGSRSECDSDTPFYGRLPRGIPTGSCASNAEFKLPFANYDDNPNQNWFYRNRWYEHIYYHPVCTQGNGCVSNISLNGDVGYAALVATFGRALDSQDRSTYPNDISQYLDSTESTDGDTDYFVSAVDDANNDVALTVELPDS